MTDFEKSQLTNPTARPALHLGEKYIYLVGCNEFTKIGIASDVKKRLWNMQSGCPYELKLLACWLCECPEVAEECMHANLEAFRARGEWFVLPPKDLAWLVAMPDLKLFT